MLGTGFEPPYYYPGFEPPYSNYYPVAVVRVPNSDTAAEALVADSSVADCSSVAAAFVADSNYYPVAVVDTAAEASVGY